MRTFVIQRPGLSAGRPGSHLTAVELRMDDDQLDAFVEAGYAIEVYADGERPKGRVHVEAPADVDLVDLNHWTTARAGASEIDTARHPSASRPKRKRRVS